MSSVFATAGEEPRFGGFRGWILLLLCPVLALCRDRDGPGERGSDLCSGTHHAVASCASGGALPALGPFGPCPPFGTEQNGVLSESSQWETPPRGSLASEPALGRLCPS